MFIVFRPSLEADGSYEIKLMLQKLLESVQGQQQLATAGVWPQHPDLFGANIVFITDYTAWLLSAFPARSYCQFKGLLILFPCQLPYSILFFFQYFSPFLGSSTFLSFCSPTLCALCAPKARAWCWQHKTPLMPLGKASSSVPVNFATSQGTFTDFRLIVWCYICSMFICQCRTWFLWAVSTLYIIDVP